MVSDASSLPNWPSFQGQAKLIGTSQSGRVTVYVDPTLGSPGITNANDLLADADRVVQANDTIFGANAGTVNVIVFALNNATDGTGGADHAACNYITGNAIEVCASFGNSARVSALFEAELSECNMNGTLCGVSTGEALSRWCAAVVGHNALADFATAPTWAQQGMPDWVNNTDPTDQNVVSTGCGMAFISWLLSTNFTLPAIAQGLVPLGASGTFAQLYGVLSNAGPATAWTQFQAAVNALPNGVTTDDPFNALPAPATLVSLATSHRLRLPA